MPERKREKMIVKNKRTRETLDITLEEFKKKFAKEIEESMDSYERTVLAKPTFPPFKTQEDIESGYYLAYGIILITTEFQIGILKKCNRTRAKRRG